MHLVDNAKMYLMSDGFYYLDWMDCCLLSVSEVVGEANFLTLLEFGQDEFRDSSGRIYR